MVKEIITLNKLNFTFKQRYKWDKKSEAPKKLYNWMQSQKKYQKDSIGFELFQLYTMYSCRIFQDYVFEKKTNEKWDNIDITPDKAVEQLNKYILNAPPTKDNMFVYRGISIKTASKLGIYSKTKIIEKGFLTCTFNIEHAFNYTKIRNRLDVKKYKHCCLMKISVPIGAKCIHIDYEDIVLFPINTQFIITNIKKINFGEKEKVYPVTIVSCEIIKS